MNGKVLSLVAGLGFAVSGASSADHPQRVTVPPPEPPAFAEVDEDGDEMVTETEFVGFLETLRGRHAPPPELGERRSAAFKEGDLDGDGQLSEEEFANMPHKVIHHRMRLPDPGAFFAEGDTDLDGVLNEREFDALMSKLRMRRHPGDLDEQ